MVFLEKCRTKYGERGLMFRIIQEEDLDNISRQDLRDYVSE